MKDDELNTNNKIRIKTVRQEFPQIYAYKFLNVPDFAGWVKIGYTTRENAKDRIHEQLKIMGDKINYEILWIRDAVKDGAYFMDHVLHKYLVKYKEIEKMEGHEWFYYGVGKEMLSLEHFDDFVGNEISQASLSDVEIVLRDEQRDAVSQMAACYRGDKYSDFLLNAKARFGKTITAYSFIEEEGIGNTIIMTNRPAIGDSWETDFQLTLGRSGSHTLIMSKARGKAMDYRDYLKIDKENRKPFVAFFSMQDLKGSRVAGGNFDKYDWLFNEDIDVVMVDESHEGLTGRVQAICSQLAAKFTVYLSGTPYKAIRSGQFKEENCYTWTYLSERKRKAAVEEENERRAALGLDLLPNPYKTLPSIALYTYDLSDMMDEKLTKGFNAGGELVPFSFDLGETFRAIKVGKVHKFVHEETVLAFLDALVSRKGFPFSDKAVRDELKHTMWFMHSINSASAMQTLLAKHPVFENYSVVAAYGDKSNEQNDELREVKGKTLEKVRKNIAENERTITITVGQLTTGITIPELTGILMLSNIQSHELYTQSSFRVQNKWEYTIDGDFFFKEKAYIFDFNPTRALQVVDHLAMGESLKEHPDENQADQRVKKRAVGEMLNYLDVLTYDGAGEMVRVEVSEIFERPNREFGSRLASSGFSWDAYSTMMKNIQISTELQSILDKLEIREGTKNKAPEKLSETTLREKAKTRATELNTKKFEKIEDTLKRKLNTLKVWTSDEDEEIINSLIRDNADEIGGRAGLRHKLIEDAVSNGYKLILDKVEETEAAAARDKNIAEIEYNSAVDKSFDLGEGNASRAALNEDYEDRLDEIEDDLRETINNSLLDWGELALQETKSQLELMKKEKADNFKNKENRSKLQGFLVTIPLIVKAYGDRNLTMENLPTYVDSVYFEELTGITEEDYSLLYKEIFALQEGVFNYAIQAVLDRMEETKYYFREDGGDPTSDIQPQKTNQIFTAMSVVKLQLDKMEETFGEDLWSDPSRTYVDFYCKSGTYLMEVARRLFAGLAEVIPDEGARITHILERQLYAFCPTPIIHDIVITNLFHFDNEKAISRRHIMQADVTELAKIKDYKSIENIILENTDAKDGGFLYKDLLSGKAGEMKVKFDYAVGNPPYQEDTTASPIQLWPKFIELSGDLSNNISLIHPGRWVVPKASMGKVRDMLIDTGLVRFTYFPDSKKVFPAVDIDGGVSMTFISNGYSDNILYSINEEKEELYTKTTKIFINQYEKEAFTLMKTDYPESINDLIRGNQGSLGSSEFGYDKKTHMNMLSDTDEGMCDPIKVWANKGYGREGARFAWYFIEKNKLNTVPAGMLDSRKVMLDKKGHSPSCGRGNVINNIPQIVEKNAIGNGVLFVIPHADTEYELQLIKSYFMTKTVRFLMSITQKDLTVRGFDNVPDYKYFIEELNGDLFTDQFFYDKFGFSEELIAHIEKVISEKTEK